MQFFRPINPKRKTGRFLWLFVVHFSSVQSGIHALGKACMRSTPSLGLFFLHSDMQVRTREQGRSTLSMRVRCSCCPHRTHRIDQTSLPATSAYSVPEVMKQLKGCLFKCAEDAFGAFTRGVRGMLRSALAEKQSKWFQRMPVCCA